MPMKIEHIDAIARQKQRDVLYVVFHPPASDHQNDDDISGLANETWETLPIREQVIAWLDAQGIGWKPCGHVADERSMWGYRGQIYIDVPYDKSLPTFQSLEAFFEFPDGTMRFPQASFFYLPLAKAMENAAHDAPGFWAQWAEHF